jgi:hypothetical protein
MRDNDTGELQVSDSTEKRDNIWEVVNNINYEREPLSFDDIKGIYDPWLINKALSTNKDTIFIAEQMNECWTIDADMHYAYVFNAVEKRKRYGKWYKHSKDLDEKIQLLKDRYNYSTLKAREMVPLVDQLGLWDAIKLDLDRGGVKKTKRSKESKN